MCGVRLLLVEDDVRMAAALRRGLNYEGIVTDVTGRGTEASASPARPTTTRSCST